MKRMGNRQAGFGPIELLVAIGVIVVLGAVGWVMYQRHISDNKPKAATTTSQTTSQQHSTTTTQPQPVAYLDIKEWGMKLPLSDTVKDAYYVVPTGISSDADGRPSAIALGLTSMSSSCGTISTTAPGYGNSLGAIIRALPNDTDPVSGQLYTQKYPGGVTVGGYYYAYLSRTNGRTCAAPSTLQSIDTAFAATTKGVASDSATN